MTREEVKAQLAKRPLEWEAGQGEMVAHLPKLTRWIDIKYSVRWGELAVDVCSDEECVTDYIASRSYSEINLKAEAEAHRLDFVCRLLGIND